MPKEIIAPKVQPTVKPPYQDMTLGMFYGFTLSSVLYIILSILSVV